MKKHVPTLSEEEPPRSAKRKPTRRSPEGEAEEEADAKWGKKFKVEPGIDAAPTPSNRPKTESATPSVKANSAADALKRRRTESASASTPTSTAPSKHDSVIDCALKVLAEVPLDDDRFVPSAIKTFTEDHITPQLPPPFSLDSRISFVVQHVHDQSRSQDRAQQVSSRLKNAEAMVFAAWVSSFVKDQDVIHIMCTLLLDNTSGFARRASGTVKTPQPTGTNPSKAIPTPPSSSRTNSASGADFDVEAYASSKSANRKELARLHFPGPLDLFTYHVEHFVQEDPADAASPWPHPQELWSRLDEEQRDKWQHLLSRLHIDGSKSLLKKGAHSLLAEQFLERSPPQVDLPDWSSEAQSTLPVELEPLATPSVETAESIKPDDIKFSPADTDNNPSLADIPSVSDPPAPLAAPSHQLFTRPTLVPFITHDPIPNTYSVLLPINTPTCPIPDITLPEVHAACLATFGQHHGDASVEQLSPHAWIVTFTGKARTDHANLLYRPLKLRDRYLRSEFLPREPPRFFEADFTAALHIPSDEILREVRWAFATEDQRPQLAQQLAYGRRKILAYFVEPVELFRFYVPFVGHPLNGDGTPFVACWRPMKIKARCWVCSETHGGRCPRAEVLELG
ncbi:hypothetical protein PRZ48_008740 [Zasmidium cellare]|uniref:Uncharacterized protein n=1 Tax=Zasmidium cellare TaxID=395010 RepID=A0ABR0EGB8_ZASCE|nr:hypothetical protein PRZ48_008740 [Zasmidium cellare]